MKKSLLILSLTLLAFGAEKAIAQVTYPVISAQADDMEVWASDAANPNVKDPNNSAPGTAGWQCFNLMTSPLLGSSPQSVFKDSTTVHTGSYSAKIVSVVLTATSYNYVKSFIPHDTVGVILTATFQTSPSPKLVPGAPFTGHISSFSFWYQYAPQMNSGKPDTASCSVVLTKAHVSIGGGYITMNAAGTWTNVTVPIFYTAVGNPDTIIVLFSSSSQYKPAPGSTLLIDGVAPLNVNEVTGSGTTNVAVYPNPASDQINFRVDGENAHSIKVYDITGKEVNTYAVKDNMLSLNTSGFATGMYIYQLCNKEGAVMKIGKFTVER